MRLFSLSLYAKRLLYMVAVLVIAGFSFAPGEAAGQVPVPPSDGPCPGGLCRYEYYTPGVADYPPYLHVVKKRYCYTSCANEAISQPCGCPSDARDTTLNLDEACAEPCWGTFELDYNVVDDVYILTIEDRFGAVVFEARFISYSYQNLNGAQVLTWEDVDHVSATGAHQGGY